MPARTGVTILTTTTSKVSTCFFVCEQGTAGGSSVGEVTFTCTSAMGVREHLSLSVPKRQTLLATKDGQNVVEGVVMVAKNTVRQTQGHLGVTDDLLVFEGVDLGSHVLNLAAKGQEA